MPNFTAYSQLIEEYANLRLNIIVQRELVRMGPGVNGLNLILHLVADPCFDQVLAEDVALEQEVVVLFPER